LFLIFLLGYTIWVRDLALFYTFVNMYFFRKKDQGRPTNFDIKIMHVINVLAISIFLIGIILKLTHLI
jgi:hypothetical protein